MINGLSKWQDWNIIHSFDKPFIIGLSKRPDLLRKLIKNLISWFKALDLMGG